MLNELEISDVIEKGYLVVKKSGQIKQVSTLNPLLVGQANKNQYI